MTAEETVFGKMTSAKTLGAVSMDTPNGILAIRYKDGVFTVNEYGGKLLLKTKDWAMVRNLLISCKKAKNGNGR